MNRPRRILLVLAHPDDETLGFGGILAKYAAEGAETAVLTATRGERGWFGDPADNPGLWELGRMREAELRASARVLGITHLDFLDYVDGDLDRAEPGRVIGRIVRHIRLLRPDVVLTFGYDGLYGHPDHIAICQFTTSAVVAAADPSYHSGPPLSPHRVAKLYYRAATPSYLAAYEEAFGELVMQVDGVTRRGHGWPEWAVTTVIDAAPHWRRVWEAVQCHRSQLPGYDRLRALPGERHRYLWGTQELYRVFSQVSGGREVERDLFAGIPVEDRALAAVS